MPRKPATREQKDKIRRRIQKAAAAVYEDQGISGVSARLVADRAGVSVGTIYAHFDSLQVLMQSLWMGPVEALNAHLRSIAEATPDPVARARALMTGYVEFALSNLDLYRGAFLFVRPGHLPKPPKEELASADFPALLIIALKEGQAHGAIREGSPALMAQMLWAGLHGAIALPMNIDRLQFDEPRALAEQMVDTLLSDLTSKR